MKLEISIRGYARGSLKKLPAPVAIDLLRRIQLLSTEPFARGCEKLSGHGGLYRVRVGNYRIIYSVDEAAGVLEVYCAGHRKDIYRQL